MRLLLVDDDPGLRALVRVTFDDISVDIDEADSVAAARKQLAHARPDVIVLDVLMPGESGLDFCRALKADPETASIPVVLLSGSVGAASRVTTEAGADAFLPKPFSPLQLLAVVERLAGGSEPIPLVPQLEKRADNAQLMMYARDLRQILELERAQRRLVQEAYHQTVAALADALATKDTGTRAHSHRVQVYALELARAVDPALVEDPSLEYGFLLHDVGKIGIPDQILLKPGPLNDDERRLMQQHPVLGDQMLSGIAFLQGEGISIVRSHHERWDGRGYPDGLEGTSIPIAARVFAVADALDAMTTDRPYRPAGSWADAAREIEAQSGTQFDPSIVNAFRRSQGLLQQVHSELQVA
jgi:response regulator RpfG family c-di-GMP phosphodiesterase